MSNMLNDLPYNAIESVSQFTRSSAAAAGGFVASSALGEFLAADALVVAGITVTPAVAVLGGLALGAGLAVGVYYAARVAIPAVCDAAEWLGALRLTTEPRAVVTEMTPADIDAAYGCHNPASPTRQIAD
jgi:hypothetical protein